MMEQAVLRREETVSEESASKANIVWSGLAFIMRHAREWLRWAGVPRREISQLLKQLAVMLDAGLSLERALEILLAQTSRPYLREALDDILNQLRGGMSLYHALAGHHQLFPTLALQMVKVGESGGVLTDMLYRASEYIEHQYEINRRILTALAYPSIVFVFAIAAVLGISFFIMPMFGELYQASGVSLPAVTVMVIYSAEFIRHYGCLILVLILAGSFILIRAMRHAPFALRVHQKLLFLPLLGNTVRGLAIMRITETLAVLLKVGVPALTALETAGKTAGNLYLQKVLEETCSGMRAGQSIARSLAKDGVFDEMYTRMIAAGEESGSLAEMLAALAAHLKKDLLHRLDSMIALLEPALIVIVAFLVGTTVIATLLPMYSLMDLAGGM